MSLYALHAPRANRAGSALSYSSYLLHEKSLNFAMFPSWLMEFGNIAHGLGFHRQRQSPSSAENFIGHEMHSAKSLFLALGL